jgi:hypothetical protein
VAGSQVRWKIGGPARVEHTGSDRDLFDDADGKV